MAEQLGKVLEQRPNGSWRSDCATEESPAEGNLVVGLTGSFDSPEQPSYQSWKTEMTRELGAKVIVPSFYDLPGVRRVGSSKRGPVYRCDWSLSDRFNQIARAIRDVRPRKTVLLGFGLGALEATHSALALNMLGYPIDGVIDIAPANYLYKPGKPYAAVNNRSGIPFDPTVELRNTTPPWFRGNPLKERLSCVRFSDIRNTQSSAATTLHMLAWKADKYNFPFNDILPIGESGFRLRFRLSETLGNGHYDVPTAFIGLGQSDYVPATDTRALTGQTKYAPTEYIEIPKACYDFQAFPDQVECVTQAVIDLAGQIFTTRTVRRSLSLNQMLATGQPVAVETPQEVIVLSSARPPEYHVPIVHLAAQAGTPLVALTSRGLKPQQVAISMERAGASGVIADLPPGFRLKMTADFASPKHPCVADRDSDLWTKRNLGLLLRRNVIFLDDDTRDLTPTDLAWADAVLASFKIAGFVPRHFRDKSVVYHADHLAGGDQNLEAVSISGNSLAVSAEAAAESFFDRGYNEDRTFASKFVEEGSAALLGEVRQLEYDPYASPERAASEVFGDVLADGLFYLQGLGMSYREVGEDFWQFAIWRYRHLINDVANRLTIKLDNGDRDEQIPNALASLRAARAQLDTYTAPDPASYVQDWHDDLTGRWPERYAKLPEGMSSAETLAYHGLTAWVVNCNERRSKTGLLY